MEPRDMKYKDIKTSPLCASVSPGGAWVVLNFNDNALKIKKLFNSIYQIYLPNILGEKTYLRQPGDAPLKALQFLSKLRFKCKQISACKHSGNAFSTLFISIPFVYVHACWNHTMIKWHRIFITNSNRADSAKWKLSTWFYHLKLQEVGTFCKITYRKPLN